MYIYLKLTLVFSFSLFDESALLIFFIVQDFAFVLGKRNDDVRTSEMCQIFTKGEVLFKGD